VNEHGPLIPPPPGPPSPKKVKESISFTRYVERSLDEEPEFPIRDFYEKILRRKWIVTTCVVVPIFISLGLTLLTPMTWQASTKILIRYSSSESAFLKGLIPDDRVSLSGAASSEIIRSLPTLEEVVRKLNVQPSDLYQSNTRVIAERIGKLFHNFLPEREMPSERNLAQIATRLQDSLQASSASSAGKSKAAPIEVLSSTSNLPQASRGDELITLTVKAFNRAKVAELTNGLAQAFLDQYYKISAEDAQRSVDFLTKLADRLEEDERQLEQGSGHATSDSPLSLEGDANAGGADGGIARDSPAMTTLANQLATLEASLGRARQVYKEGAPQIERQEAEIESIRTSLSDQERLTVAKQALGKIKERRFQALNTVRLYQDRVAPISVIEPAVTPPQSILAQVVRLITSGLTGLLIGAVFGLTTAILLGMLDSRLFTTADVEKSLGLPVVGSVPRLKSVRSTKDGLYRLADDAVLVADNGLSQLIGRLHTAGIRDDPDVVAVTSTGDEDGKSFVSLLLAKSVARHGDRRVLLIDADPGRATLSRTFAGKIQPPGEAKIGLSQPHFVQIDESNIDLLVQTLDARQSVFQYSRWLRSALVEARGLYDLVIVDTPSLALSGRTLVCCDEAGIILLVVRSGINQKGPVRSFLRRLKELSISPAGVILNFVNKRL